MSRTLSVFNNVLMFLLIVGYGVMGGLAFYVRTMGDACHIHQWDMSEYLISIGSLNTSISVAWLCVFMWYLSGKYDTTIETAPSFYRLVINTPNKIFSGIIYNATLINSVLYVITTITIPAVILLYVVIGSIVIADNASCFWQLSPTNIYIFIVWCVHLYSISYFAITCIILPCLCRNRRSNSNTNINDNETAPINNTSYSTHV